MGAGWISCCLVLAAMLVAPAGGRAQIDGNALATAFHDPPAEAKPWVYWYWMNAAVTRAGITADLEAMKAAGIGGAYLMPIEGATRPPLIDPPAEQLNPVWWDCVRWAFTEADCFGLKLAMYVCDGFATAGGPWITPELSMQKVVWSETQVAGGDRVELALAQPETNAGYYRDIAVLAFPELAGAGVSSRSAAPVVTSSLPGPPPFFLPGGPGEGTFVSENPCWIQYAFPEPFTCRSLTIRVPPAPNAQTENTYQANRLVIETSDDGIHFLPFVRLEPPRHGWQDGDADVTHAVPAVTSRYFRFRWDPAESEAGAEDLDSAKWKPVLKVCAVELSGEARINGFEGKSGAVWRIAPTTTMAQVPIANCAPAAQIVNLTAHLDQEGRFIWDAPPGRWTVLRIGHTSTGHTNHVGGGGLGLECDKFNPDAVRLQFDHWFGEIIRRVGPDLAGRVLQVFHVDSWECGSQNWSPVFRDEFIRRRGYDPLRYLPAMAGIPVESVDVSERFLRDVRETIGELLIDNFFRPLAALAHGHGCVFSAESVAPTMEVDGMAHFSVVDIPMGEFWLRSPTHDKLNDILDAVSGAHIYGHPITQAEAFTELRLSWDEAPAMLKALGDRNFCLGINRFVIHVFAHNPWLDRRPGMTLEGVGLYFQRDQTWWRPGRAWVDYLARCQAMLQLGRPVEDVAVFTGDGEPRRALVPWALADTLPGFFPVPDNRRSRQILEAGDWVDPLHGFAYDSVNRDALLRRARVRDGRIELPGGPSYALLIVPAPNRFNPAADSFTPEVATRLQELVAAGVTVLLGAPPTRRSPTLQDYPHCDEAVAQAVNALWPVDAPADGTIHQKGGGRVITGPVAAASFERFGLAPGFTATDAAGGRADGIAWTHRAGEGWDFYFISNQHDAAREIDVSVRVTGRVPELWDPVTAERRVAGTWRMRDGRTGLPLRLPPRGSLFLVLRTPTTKEEENGAPNWTEPATVQTIAGPWQVAFDAARGGPVAPVPFERLVSWTESTVDGIRHYSGTASYTRSFSWQSAGAPPHRVWLDLGRVANLAEVSVNGIPCGVAWTPPYRVEVTAALHPGGNQLRVDVTNTWFNRLAGDQKLPPAERRTWTTAPDRTERKPLLDAGLLGPVTLRRD